MCIIIALPAKSAIKEEIKHDILVNCWNSNLDGAGYTYIDNGKVKIRKGFFNFKPFYKSFTKDRQRFKDSRFLVHMRYGTAGKVDYHNCHPFMVNNISMAHNGHIYKFSTDKTKEASDSKQFAEFIKELPDKWWLNDGINYLVSKFLGSNNKMAILRPDNVVTIYNPDKWFNEEDISYSSEYYKIPRKEPINSQSNTLPFEKENNPNTLPLTPIQSNIQALAVYEQYKGKAGEDFPIPVRICESTGCGLELLYNEHRVCNRCAEKLKISNAHIENIYG